MTQLVIEYVFEGHQRGYNFTSPTDHVDDDTLKHIWRNAMPRGQGWGDFIGARSLKAFPVDDAKIALADVMVTDLQDERGRKGIRRATVALFSEMDYFAHLQDRLSHYSESIRARAEDRLTICKRTNIISKTLPKFRRDAQLILVRPFKTPDDHQVMEAFSIMLALEPVISMKRWGGIVPFTTLALDHHEESRMVVIPESRSQKISAPTVSLR